MQFFSDTVSYITGGDRIRGKGKWMGQMEGYLYLIAMFMIAMFTQLQIDMDSNNEKIAKTGSQQKKKQMSSQVTAESDTVGTYLYNRALVKMMIITYEYKFLVCFL